jgi:hypothetical protein
VAGKSSSIASIVNIRRYLKKLTRALGGVAAPAYGRTDGAPYERRHRPLALVAGVTAFILMLSWRGECWAYIDPNAGGFLSQILAPLAAIFVSFLFYCRKEARRYVKSVRDRWKKARSRSAVPGPETHDQRETRDGAHQAGK